jgi:SAM-dependent methyltransferase
VIRRLLRRLRRRATILPAPPPLPAAVATPSGEPLPQCVAGIELHACTVFNGYLLLRGIATLVRGMPEEALTVSATQDGRTPPQTWRAVDWHGGGSLEFAVEALIDRARPVAEVRLEFHGDGRHTAWRVADILPSAQWRDLRTLVPEFQDMIRAAAAGGRRPRLLDIGGRARSGNRNVDHFPEADATIFDIVPGEGVDVVGDAHELSRHFPPDSFDFAVSVSVFEHLLMPWKVAVEMSRVLKPGGIALIHTHQAEAMHDMPWDFWRFSDTAWQALFNPRTGFEIVKVDISRRMHLVPAVIIEPVGDNENAFGFQCSTVMARKTGPATVDWPVPLAEVVRTSYPRGG